MKTKNTVNWNNMICLTCFVKEFNVCVNKNLIEFTVLYQYTKKQYIFIGLIKYY